MKKTYEKPLVIIESFELNQTIAAGCGVPGGGTTLGKPGWGDKNTCGWDVGGHTLWLPDSVCSIPLDADATGYGVCYNTPSGGYSIFNS